MNRELGIVLLLLVVGTALFVGLTAFMEMPKTQEHTTKKIPKFTIGEYSHIVSSEKPEAIIAKFSGIEESLQKQGTELTIYNQNLALVKEIRELELKKGLNLVKYTDIAEQVMPETVLFKDLEDESTFVVEQNYEYDIVSKAKLLEKYLDKEITVKTKDEQIYTGKLLSYSTTQGLDQILLETAEKVISLNDVQEIYFPSLSEGLITKPSLVWKLYTESDGNRLTQTTYLTKGMTWEADYIAKVNQDDTILNFSGWVTINNTSGTAYPNTSLKLIAGDLHLVGTPVRYKVEPMYKEIGMPTATPEQFVEEALYEYHMYTLERKTDIKNNEKKQISLLSAEGVPVTKKFVFDPQRIGWYRYNSTEEQKIQVLLEFKNSEEKGLGMPLPKGIVRVYKEDSQGKLQFVGEDRINHTPKDEELSLLTGYAFDIVGEKKTVDYRDLGRCNEYDYEVKLRNHKEEPVTVYVVEHTYGDNEITKSSHSYEKKNAFTYEFPVQVAANGEATLTYTVRTCW